MNTEKYIVWCESYGESQEDGWEIDALDEQQACEEWADLDDAYNASYSIAGGEPVDVLVLKEGSTLPPERYSVSGEAVLTYHAERLRETPAKDTTKGVDNCNE